MIKGSSTKVRKDQTILPGKPGIDLLLPDERDALQRRQETSSSDCMSHPNPSLGTRNCEEDTFAVKTMTFVRPRCSSLGTRVGIRTGFDEMTSRGRPSGHGEYQGVRRDALLTGETAAKHPEQQKVYTI